MSSTRSTTAIIPAWGDDFSKPDTGLQSAAFLNLFVDHYNAAVKLINDQITAYEAGPNYGVNTDDTRIPLYLRVNYYGAYGSGPSPAADYTAGVAGQSAIAIIDNLQQAIDTYIGTGQLPTDGSIPQGLFQYFSPSMAGGGWNRDDFRRAAGIDVARGWRRMRAREFVNTAAVADVWGNPAAAGQRARLCGAGNFKAQPQNAGQACYTYVYTAVGRWVLDAANGGPDVLDSDAGEMPGGVAAWPGDYVGWWNFKQIHDAFGQLKYLASTINTDPVTSPGVPAVPVTPTPPTVTACPTCTACGFALGATGRWAAPCAGTLRVFFNDAVGEYGDNSGAFLFQRLGYVMGESANEAYTLATIQGNDPVGLTYTLAANELLQWAAGGTIDSGGHGAGYYDGGPAGEPTNSGKQNLQCPAAPYGSLAGLFVPATPAATSGVTVLDFSDVTEGQGDYHIAYPADYGSNRPNTPNVAVSYGPNNLLDGYWSVGIGFAMFANPTALVTITFTPAAGHAVTLQSFAASLYTGDADGSYTFATLKVVDANGNVLWNPDPSTYPELTFRDKTTFSPNVTGPAGVAITLQFQDTATDGEVGCSFFTFSQT